MIVVRIDKSLAIGALHTEISRLSAQIAACDDQFARLVGISTPGLEGEAAREFRANVRRYAVVILAHKCFYQAVRNADSQNAFLVSALPTTDGSVLDTEVAAARIRAAEQAIARLRMQKERAVSNAQEINAAIALASAVGGVGVSALVKPVDIDAVIRYYDSLIDAQYAIIEHNRMILAMASRYDAQSASLYQAVDANVLRQSTDMMVSLLNRGVWGSMAWGVDFLSHTFSSVGFGGQVGAGAAAKPDGGSSAAWQRFLDGESETEGAAFRVPNGSVSSAPAIGAQNVVQASDIGGASFASGASGIAVGAGSSDAAGIGGIGGGAAGSISGIDSAQPYAKDAMGSFPGGARMASVGIEHADISSTVGAISGAGASSVSPIETNVASTSVNVTGAPISAISFDASDNQVSESFDFDLGRLGVGMGISVDWGKYDIKP